MAVFMDFLYHFFSFDVAWLVGFIFSPENLLWLFLFAAAAYYFYSTKNSKDLFWSTVFITVYIWASVDFTAMVGWQLFDSNLLMLLILGGFVTLAFFANDSWGKTRLPLINTLRFVLLLAFFNLVLL